MLWGSPGHMQWPCVDTLDGPSESSSHPSLDRSDEVKSLQLILCPSPQVTTNLKVFPTNPWGLREYRQAIPTESCPNSRSTESMRRFKVLKVGVICYMAIVTRIHSQRIVVRIKLANIYQCPPSEPGHGRGSQRLLIMFLYLFILFSLWPQLHLFPVLFDKRWENRFLELLPPCLEHGIILVNNIMKWS